MRHDTLLIFLGMLLTFTVGLGVLLFRCARREPQVVVKTETVYETVYKTVFRDRPDPVKTQILPDRYFFIPVETVKTVIRNDTTYLQLPVEQKTYSDTLYTAWVSGYNPQLDSIRLRIPTTYVTTTVKEPAPRWSFGVTAGPGLLVTPAGQLHGGVGVTLGVQYRF